jgi:hypothetical protein
MGDPNCTPKRKQQSGKRVVTRRDQTRYSRKSACTGVDCTDASDTDSRLQSKAKRLSLRKIKREGAEKPNRDGAAKPNAYIRTPASKPSFSRKRERHGRRKRKSKQKKEERGSRLVWLALMEVARLLFSVELQLEIVTKFKP